MPVSRLITTIRIAYAKIEIGLKVRALNKDVGISTDISLLSASAENEANRSPSIKHIEEKTVFSHKDRTNISVFETPRSLLVAISFARLVDIAVLRVA